MNRLPPARTVIPGVRVVAMSSSCGEEHFLLPTQWGWGRGRPRSVSNRIFSRATAALELASPATARKVRGEIREHQVAHCLARFARAAAHVWQQHDVVVTAPR